MASVPRYRQLQIHTANDYRPGRGRLSTEYDSFAANFEYQFIHHTIDINPFMRAANLQPSDNLLDLGTGIGLIPIHCLQHQLGEYICGVDVSTNCVTKFRHAARRLVPKRLLRWDGVRADFTIESELDAAVRNELTPDTIEDGFDVITLLWTIDCLHPQQHVNFLSMVRNKFLKPGGRIVISKQDPYRRIATIELVTGWADDTSQVCSGGQVRSRLWVGDEAHSRQTFDEFLPIVREAGFLAEYMGPLPDPAVPQGSHQDHSHALAVEVQNLQSPAQPVTNVAERAKINLCKRLVTQFQAGPFMPSPQARTRVNSKGHQEQFIVDSVWKHAGAAIILYDTRSTSPIE